MCCYLNRILIAFFILTGAGLIARAAERDALLISDTIQQRHMPHGIVVAPVFASPTSSRIVSYSRGGDSAIWTGHYLAAEAFRYRITASPQALERVWAGLRGIRSLRQITGTDLLARCLMPSDWAFASAITHEEAGHGIYTGSLDGRTYYWVGNTSRDQYAGVFFGLAIAYDMVDDQEVRQFIREEVTALLNFLLEKDWAVVMPNNSVSTVFWGRVDQQLTLLQIGRRVNPDRFDSIYQSYRGKYASAIALPIAFEALDEHGSYFKFNIDSISLYNLIRLEDSPKYRKQYMRAYKILRQVTRRHENAHFNMIDRGLKEADSNRDAETRNLLDEWLKRPRRDAYVDLRLTYPACDRGRACAPISVTDRVRTDFLWQRSPFQLSGGGDGRIETAGIDYILPYWMARFYSVL